GHPEVPLAVDGGLAAAVLELAEWRRTADGDADTPASPAEPDERVPAQVVLVDVVRVAVDGIDPAVLPVDRHPTDVAPRELADARPLPPEPEQELPGRGEHRDP